MIGIGLSVFTVVVILAALIFHKWTYKVTGNYYFLAALSVIFLSYFIAVRWTSDLNSLVNLNYDKEIKDMFGSFLPVYEKEDVIQYIYSFRWSKVLLLDLCPLMAFLLPLSIICDKSKNIAKVLSPMALLGGVITVFGELSSSSVYVNWYTFIFIGQGNDLLFFFIHFYSIVLSILVLLNSKTFTKWSLLGTITYLAVYLIYVSIIMKSLNITNNTTGLSANDWVPIEIGHYDTLIAGQYRTIKAFLGGTSFPGIVVLMYSLALSINFVIMIIKNKLTKNIDNDAHLSVWYIKVSWLDKILNPINIWTDHFLKLSKNKLILYKSYIIGFIRNRILNKKDNDRKIEID